MYDDPTITKPTDGAATIKASSPAMPPKGVERAARLLQWVLHPVVMTPLMVLMIVAGMASPLKYPMVVRLYVMANVVALTVVLPWCMRSLIGYMERRRGVENSGRTWRIVALLVQCICFVACGYVFDGVVVLALVRKVLYTAAVVTGVTYIMERIFPLDYHTVALGGLLGMMWMLLYVGNFGLLVPFVVLILLSGLLCTVRLWLTEAKVLSVVGGLVVGFALSATMLIFI